MMYLVIFLISILTTGILLFFSYVKNSQTSDIVDTLLVAIPADIPFEEDTVEMQEIDVHRTFVNDIEEGRKTFLDRASGSQQQRGLAQHEQEYVSLVEQLRALFGDGTVPEEEEEEIIEEIIEEEIVRHPSREEILEIANSTLSAQLDTNRLLIQNYRRENERLRENLLARNDEIDALNYLIASLRETIVYLDNQILMLETPEEIEIEVIEPDYRQLARIFNNMDASRVAQILQTLPPETAVNVLRSMNQRRISQVMAALPPRIATQYSQLIMN